MSADAAGTIAGSTAKKRNRPYVVYLIVFMGLTGYCQGNPLFEAFLLLEACSPPAVALTIQVKKYGGDDESVSAGLLIAYLGCLVTIPVFLSLWQVFSG